MGYKEPSTANGSGVYKTSYQVIDIHTHCYSATEEAMRAEFEVADQVGVTAVVVLDGDSPAGSLPAWMKVKRTHPDRIGVLWKLSFANTSKETFFSDIVHDVKMAAQAGVQGVKVWKDLGMYARDGSGQLLSIDDERLDPFWSACGSLGLPVLWHVADPREYWYPLTYNCFHYGFRDEENQHYHDQEMPSWEELIRQRDTVLKKHPHTTFIGAHMGSQSFALQQLGEALDSFPNFHVDTSARLRILGRLNPNAVRDFFITYQERILFGTDLIILSKGRTPGSRGGNLAIYPNEDPDWLWTDPSENETVRRWQERAALLYSRYFRYFETDRVDLDEPSRWGPWLRMAGIKLPPAVLEKLYHANAERIIPGMKQTARTRHSIHIAPHFGPGH